MSTTKFQKDGDAQAIAAQESSWTTKFCDRTSGEITLDEVERIAK